MLAIRWCARFSRLQDLEQQQSATQEFLKEAADMTSLNHSYVVSILGICMGGGLSIVLELIPYGALESESTVLGHLPRRVSAMRV